MAKIIICAPPQTQRSDGAKALYLLSRSLREIGYDSYILMMDLRDKTFQSFAFIDEIIDVNDLASPRYLTPKDTIDLNNDVFVYPEIISGNPLNARFVARYFLNKEANLTGKAIDIASTDLLLTFQGVFRPDASFKLFYPMIDISAADDIEPIEMRHRPISTTYLGKGVKYGECTRVPGTIGLDWEKSYEEYQLLLKNSNFLFTWDYMSGTCGDAIVRGAVLVIMNFAPWSEQEIKKGELPFPYITYEEYKACTNEPELLRNFFNQREKLISKIRELRLNWLSEIQAFVSHIENTFGIECSKGNI